MTEKKGNKMYRQITVLAAITQEHLEERGADVENRDCETIKEAKQRAKYYLTEDYQHRSESSVRLCYSQVLVDGDVVYDFSCGWEVK